MDIISLKHSNTFWKTLLSMLISNKKFILFGIFLKIQMNITIERFEIEVLYQFFRCFYVFGLTKSALSGVMNVADRNSRIKCL